MTLSSNYVIETLAGEKCLATDHRVKIETCYVNQNVLIYWFLMV